MTTKYEAAVLLVQLLDQIRTNTKPWSVANAGLMKLVQTGELAPSEVAIIERFSNAARNDTGIRIAEGVEKVLGVIEPRALR